MRMDPALCEPTMGSDDPMPRATARPACVAWVTPNPSHRDPFLSLSGGGDRNMVTDQEKPPGEPAQEQPAAPAQPEASTDTAAGEPQSE